MAVSDCKEVNYHASSATTGVWYYVLNIATAGYLDEIVAARGDPSYASRGYQCEIEITIDGRPSQALPGRPLRTVAVADEWHRLSVSGERHAARVVGLAGARFTSRLIVRVRQVSGVNQNLTATVRYREE